MEFPGMLYKPGSQFEWDGEWFDYVIVADKEELDIALGDGWVSHKPTPDEEAAVEAKEPDRKVVKVTK
jgi:hypothetical protein